MNKIMSIEKFTNEEVDNMKQGEVFSARNLASQYSMYVWRTTGEYRNPFPDTIGRRLRTRRAVKGDVFYYDYGRSLWWKNDHVATPKERVERGI